MKPLTFPNRPCYPVKDAVFGDPPPPRKPDCPWSWAAALAAVLFILVMGVCR